VNSKKCTICGETKNISEFYKQSGISGRPRSNCKKCADVLLKKWRENNKNKTVSYAKKWYAKNIKHVQKYREDHKKRQIENWMTKKYGITPDEKQKIYESQLGLCVFCQKHFKINEMNIDHDHLIEEKRKSVRGLLCGPCNRLLTAVDKFGAEKIIDYIASRPAQGLLFNKAYSI
jgi:hypothetical protein